MFYCSTVWIYLFFLPFQLVQQFEWYSIPGVFIAAFIYLGFLAAGEELEQPFGKLSFSIINQSVMTGHDDILLFCSGYDVVSSDPERLLALF
jgi:predicted membrane chloride channel (bestrophin family)